jgi:murein DD-endopeptidase MepM/ murein hydrolase activator NlpD
MRTISSLSLSGKLAGRLSLLAAVAALGACSNFNGLRSPVFTGSTNQAQIISSPQPVAYAPTTSGGVQSGDLPPPVGASNPTYAAAPQPAAPAPYTPPQSYAADGLPKPLGQMAAAEPTQLGTPPTTLNQQAASIGGGGSGGVHTVQAGDTAWNISQRYGISVDQLIAANGGSSTVKLGQKIVIPGGSAPVQVASVDPQAVAPAPSPAAVSPVPAAAAITPPTPPAAAAPAAPAEQQVAVAPQGGELAPLAPQQAAPAAAQEASGFRWPVRGRIISSFGRRPDGERNDGINLAVPEGTSVKAAEDGTVIYSGNELKSYGNLVLIRHADGWVSAYAHNSDLKVQRGQEVRRGETIAISGMSGGVTTPQVHFELRKDATPVDPLQHLTES